MSTRRLDVALAVLWSLQAQTAFAAGIDSCVRFGFHTDFFPVVHSGRAAPLCVSSADYPGVLLVLKSFQRDIAGVTGVKPEIWVDSLPPVKEIILVGTLGRNPLIRRLAAGKKIGVQGIAGAWEASLVQTVEKPFLGIARALVIAGSDKRGAMYGMFGLSTSFGVSPWYWWADVPLRHHPELFVVGGRHASGPPSVKYRGIFLNDEAPDLTNWIRAKFGMAAERGDPPVPAGVANYGHEFYERLFEVILRLRGNYLWPAMWNNAFNEDDPENPPLADTYGIVMGTSHQEPMLRAQKEWDRRYKGPLGSWNYARYPDTLQKFWREGIRRNRKYESIITIGLRGADDTPMAPGGPEANMQLLKDIIGVQRKILSEEMNPDVMRVPQLWCPYKEVLDYYEAGMRVPDDVTILWPDDNWGNIRRLPTAAERKRRGGAGVYYHFDYHGGPRSYQWIDTNPIAKVWDQLSLAKQYGADRIWIVNAGHFKGYEFPLEYFMNLAWDTGSPSNRDIVGYTRRWAEREFGAAHAARIADIILRCTRHNGRRKPELLGPGTYSLVNYAEADRVSAECESIAAAAGEISGDLPDNARDAFYELVWFPAKATAVVNALYAAAGRNALYASQGRASANDESARARDLFRQDTSLVGNFNSVLAGGKWDHFMDQPHLGYTTWQDPPENSLRAVPLVDLRVPDSASMGIAVEGSDLSWPGPERHPVLPGFDVYNRQRHCIDVFNRGNTPFRCAVTADAPWIRVSTPGDEVAKESRVWVSIDWTMAPAGGGEGRVNIRGAGGEISVTVKASNPVYLPRNGVRGFVEGEGCVSIEAGHYQKKTDQGKCRWTEIESYGRTLSGMRAEGPVDARPCVPGRGAPCLEYRMYLFTDGAVAVEGIFGPALNFMPGRGVRYAVAFDNDAAQVVTLVPEKYSAQNGNRDWEKSVEDNTRRGRTNHTVRSAGYHSLKVWMVDPGVVLEKLIVETGCLRPSYLGPPESFRGHSGEEREQ